MIKKLKVMRIVTAPEAVSFHLRNTLNFISKDFETVIVGTNVEKFQSQYPEIRWINLEISRRMSLRQDLISVLKLTQLLLQEKPDIIHSIMPKAGLVAAIAGFLTRVPIRVHTFTGQVWASKSGFSRRFLIFLDRVVVYLNQYTFTDSESQSRLLFECGIKKNGNLLPVLGKGSLSGVDLKRFNFDRYSGEKKKLREDNDIPLVSTVFIFLGRKCRDKGVFELLSAFANVQASHSDTFLLFVGPDESHGELEKWISKYSFPKHCFKNVGMTEKAEEYLAMSDIFCLPSYREGFGSVVIEAGAMGLPCIGTDIPGLRDSILQNKTGLFVKVKDSNELASAMARLTEDFELRKNMGQKALEFARNDFDSRKVYQKLESFYKDGKL